MKNSKAKPSIAAVLRRGAEKTLKERQTTSTQIMSDPDKNRLLLDRLVGFFWTLPPPRTP